jgi:hypothetical protein
VVVVVVVVVLVVLVELKTEVTVPDRMVLVYRVMAVMEHQIQAVAAGEVASLHQILVLLSLIVLVDRVDPVLLY